MIKNDLFPPKPYYENKNWYGTINYYQHWLKRLLLTDGAKDTQDQLGIYWFFDMVASYLPKIAKTGQTHFTVKFTFHDEEKGIFEILDTDGVALVKQKIDYSDCEYSLMFGLAKVEGGSYVIYLFSED